MALTKVTPQSREPVVDIPINDEPQFGTRTINQSNTANTIMPLLDVNLVRKTYIIYNDTTQDFFVKFTSSTRDGMSTDDFSIRIPPGLFYEPELYCTPAAMLGIGAGTGKVRITEQN